MHFADNFPKELFQLLIKTLCELILSGEFGKSLVDFAQILKTHSFQLEIKLFLHFFLYEFALFFKQLKLLSLFVLKPAFEVEAFRPCELIDHLFLHEYAMPEQHNSQIFLIELIE